VHNVEHLIAEATAKGDAEALRTLLESLAPLSV
jgi:hypothetical protein